MTAPYPTEFERRLRRRLLKPQAERGQALGIPFLFTFEQWSEWWLTDDRWSRRGRKAGQLQMGRKGDSGPYSPDNVECATKEQKQKAQLTALSSLSPEKRAEVFKKAGLARRGEKHWRARPVVTPLGNIRHCHGGSTGSRHKKRSLAVQIWPKKSAMAGVTWSIEWLHSRLEPFRLCLENWTYVIFYTP